MAHRDDSGCRTATQHAFDAPLHALARFFVRVLAACEALCRNCVSMRGPLSACGMRRFQRVQMWYYGYPAAQAGRLPDARVRQGSCERLQPFGRNKASPKIDMGGARGLFQVSLFFDFNFLNFYFGA